MSGPRFRVGEGELEDSILGIEVRVVGELDASTLGVRLRGLRRRVCVSGAEKAKEERLRRPLKLGEETGIASRLVSSALGGRVLVSAMVMGVGFWDIPRMKIWGVEV